MFEKMFGGRCPKKSRNVAKKGDPEECWSLSAIMNEREDNKVSKNKARVMKEIKEMNTRKNKKTRCPKGEHKTKTRGCVPHTTYMIAKLAKAAASRKKKSPNPFIEE